jgi:hypothetical protein
MVCFGRAARLVLAALAPVGSRLWRAARVLWLCSLPLPCLLCLCAGLCAGGSLGCAGAFTSASVKASRAMVPVVVDESLASLEDARNRERVERILGTPEMQRAIEEAARAATTGALAPDTVDTLQGVTAQLTETVADVLARDLREKIIPASIEGMQESLHDALSPEAVAAATSALRHAVANATDAAIQAAARDLPSTLAPALRASIVESLDSPDLRASVAGIASDATRSALVSSRDVIIGLHEHGEEAGLIDHLVDRMQRLLVVTIAATFAVGAALGALVVGVLRLRRGPGTGPPSPSSPLVPAPRLDPAPTRAS